MKKYIPGINMILKVKSCLLKLLSLCVCVGGWFWCSFEGGVVFVFFWFLRNEEARREMNPDAVLTVRILLLFSSISASF